MEKITCYNDAETRTNSQVAMTITTGKHSFSIVVVVNDEQVCVGFIFIPLSIQSAEFCVWSISSNMSTYFFKDAPI